MIHLSKTAASEVKRLQSKRRNPAAKLRLGVQAGGCSGLLYTIDFDEVVKPGDVVYDCSGLVVVVDTDHLNYITGMTLDYSEDLMGGAFRFENPNAGESCGCGNSFSIQA